MTEVQPAPKVFATVPEAGTPQEDQWAKEMSLNFEGGYIKSAYGNLAQTWVVDNMLFLTDAIDVDRAGYTATRNLKIGTLGKQVTTPPSTYKRYPRRNSSSAAGGEIWTFETEVGTYTARVAGDVQDVIEFIEANTSFQRGALWVYTDRGAQYGPFNQTIL